MKKLVTIHCITYNHEKFIAQALDSFVMQKTNFQFEVVVGDDASTDSTAKIIQNYANKYPEIIKTILRNKNVGIYENYIDLASRIKTKYAIFCEGDDYFTDEYKLQKQVDFLEKNVNYSLCFHPVKIIYDNSELNSTTDIFTINKNSKLSLSLLLKKNFMQTNSVMYRWRFCNENIKDFVPENIIPIDYFMHLLHAEKGKIGFVQDIMSVYRKHSGGIWAGAGIEDSFFINNGIKHINFYQQIEKHFGVDKTCEKIDMAEKTMMVFMKNYLFGKLEGFSKEYKNLYDQVVYEKINKIDEIKYKKKCRKIKFILISSILLNVIFCIYTFLENI